ncbi:MAG: MFS transporter [Alphaproteobacteria bacterium]|nr:MAG: MFS transporter [Alphaproteobacteria bacterium]
MSAERQARDELRRGWTFILAASVGVGTSAVALPFYTVGAMVKPLSEHWGWSRSMVQGAILFSTGIGALMAPLLGMLVDRYGSRRIALPSCVGLAVAFLLAAAMDGSMWMFYGAYAAMALLGSGTSPVTWSRAVAHRFDTRRGLALGLTLTGTGLCAVLAPLYAVWLTAWLGWRFAYVGFALVLLLLTLPLVYFFLREDGPHPADHRAAEAGAWGMDWKAAMKTARFWVLFLSIACVYLATSGMIPNVIPALTDKGFAARDAALVQSTIGLSIIVGRLIVGYLIDHVWAPGVAAVALSLPVIACLIFLGEPSFALAIAAAACIGFAAGAELDLMAFLTARYFGLRHFGKLYAIYFAVLALTSGIAPSLFASVYDLTGTYQTAFSAAGFLFATGALTILAMGRYPPQAMPQTPAPARRAAKKY